jgi:YVTN family beta-propeller protein
MGKMHEGSRQLFTGRSLGRWRVPASVILGAGLLIGAVGTAVVGTAGPAGAQTVTAVTFGGTPASPTITVWGSGFGSESDLGTPQPAGGTSDCVYPPYTGSDYTNNLYFAENSQGWTAGQGSGGGGDCVGLLISSYSDNQITFGLGSGYTLAGYGQVHNGDSYALTVLGATLSGTVAFPPSSASGVGTTAYVTDPGPNTITPIDTDTNTAGTPFNFAPYEPGAIAITPNGQTAYVAPVASGSVAEVTPIQTDTNAVGTPIDTVDPVSALAISPDGSTIYAVSGSDNAVVPIDVATGTAGTPIPVGEDPSAVAFTPDGTMAYVTNYDDSSVTPIDVASGTAEPPIGVNFFPTGIAITPDGSTAFVVNSGNQTVTAIDLATQAISSPIFVGTDPVAIAITPDGSTAYVVNNGDGTVTPINTSTDVAGTAITVGSSPEAIAITPDGSTAYVADGTDDATPIDTASNTAGTPVNAGDDPVGIAITPDQAPSANLSASTSGMTTSFDASASVPGSSPIVTYAWNFGDGNTQSTTTPTTTHTYATNGTYTATVTETDAAGASTSQVFTGQTASLNGSSAAVASSTVVIATTPCTLDNSCQADISTPATPTSPAQTITVTVPPDGSQSGTLTVTSGPAQLTCRTRGFKVEQAVTSYSSTFVPTTNVQVTDFIAGPTSKRGIKICFEGSTPPPAYLKKCAPTPVPPCDSLVLEPGGVQVTLIVPGNDPRFRIDGVATLTENPKSVPTKGTIGKTLTIKGTDLLGANLDTRPTVAFTSLGGSTIAAAIATATATSISVDVPNGAETGPISIAWPTEVLVSEGSITISPPK